MGVLQPWHLIIVLVIVLFIFGPGKLPQLGKAVGDSLRDFKKSVGGDEHAAASGVEMPPGMRRARTATSRPPIADRFCGGCGGRVDANAA